jgi:hypothetical protein
MDSPLRAHTEEPVVPENRMVPTWVVGASVVFGLAVLVMIVPLIPPDYAGTRTVLSTLGG